MLEGIDKGLYICGEFLKFLDNPHCSEGEAKIFLAKISSIEFPLETKEQPNIEAVTLLKGAKI